MNLIEWFHDDLEHETHVPALFELLGIAYTGNRPLALSLCQKKPTREGADRRARPAGSARHRGRGRRRADSELDLRYPLIVKPAYDDASGGIDAGSVVRDARRARRPRPDGGRRSQDAGAGRGVHRGPRDPLRDPRQRPARAAAALRDGVQAGRHRQRRSRRCPASSRIARSGIRTAATHYAMESKCPVEDLEPEVVAADPEHRGARLPDARLPRLRARRHAPRSQDRRAVHPRSEPEPRPRRWLRVRAVRACERPHVRRKRSSEIVGFALDRATSKPKREPAPSETLLHEYLAQRGRTAR